MSKPHALSLEIMPFVSFFFVIPNLAPRPLWAYRDLSEMQFSIIHGWSQEEAAGNGRD